MVDDDGFDVPWISKIEWLRRLLNDQYLTGIPIIKELLQNADDAHATRLEIAIVPALSQNGDDARANPLFDGPALMVVNDGGFTEDNAISIRQAVQGIPCQWNGSDPGVSRCRQLPRTPPPIAALN